MMLLVFALSLVFFYGAKAYILTPDTILLMIIPLYQAWANSEQNYHMARIIKQTLTT